MAGTTETNFDVIVVGGGHAGVEAALVSARMGSKTALITFNKDRLGQMSCNPAIGGLGKGQLVKEIDALFGEMALAIDETGIQFRTLNDSKGPAVQSSRAQADRELYRKRIVNVVTSCPNLLIIEAEGSEIVLKNQIIRGLKLSDGTTLTCTSLILTTGTFLGGLMHTGEVKSLGGRIGEQASYGLSASIASLGLKMGRLKTGTPPRLRLSSIDLSKCKEQPGDSPIKPFSFRTEKIERPQISCWLTETNDATHDLIRQNVERSPMFNGQIKGRGPRYCPSIEDKVFRFAEKHSHHIFLEPEGFDSDIVYPNGISTSLPLDIQERFVRTVPGLEHVEFLVAGYAVEYDFVEPFQLSRSLECKDIPGLFLAGQINGTSGYEEAGAQGIIAGINGALLAQNLPPFTLDRTNSYIGVMIDDLTTLSVSEPYRMFTSRAEFRLSIREDNADLRLTPLARNLGLVSDVAWRSFEAKRIRISNEISWLAKNKIPSILVASELITKLNSSILQDRLTYASLIKRPELNYYSIAPLWSSNSISDAESSKHETLADSREAFTVETEIKFEGYIKRQDEEVKKLKSLDKINIPQFFDFSIVSGLSTEAIEKLSKVRPTTVAQAALISGITPAALSNILIQLKKGTPRTQLPTLNVP